MNGMGPIANCSAGSGRLVSTLISINYAKAQQEYLESGDLFNSFLWHESNKDYSPVTIEATRAGDTADVFNGVRKGAKNDSFQETDVVVFKEDFQSSLQQEMFAMGLEDDAFINDAMSCGFNLMRIFQNTDGSRIVKAYLGGSCADFPRVFEAIFDGDAQYTLTIVHNNSPIIKNVGFSPVLPNGYTSPSATFSVTYDNALNTVDVADLVINKGKDLKGNDFLIDTPTDPSLAYLVVDLWLIDKSEFTLIDSMTGDNLVVTFSFTDVPVLTTGQSFVVTVSGLATESATTSEGYYYALGNKGVSL